MDDYYYSLFRHQATAANSDALAARAAVAASASPNWPSTTTTTTTTDPFAAAAAAASVVGTTNTLHHHHLTAAATIEDYAGGGEAGGGGFGGIHLAATTAATTTNNRPTITNPALLRRKKRQRQQQQQPPRIFYHAIRPDGVLLKEPVIFFGLQDFELFSNYMQLQQSLKNNNNNNSTQNKNTEIIYRVFDRLADACAYAQGEEEEVTKDGDSHDKREQQQQEEAQASDEDESDNDETNYWREDSSSKQSRTKKRRKTTSTAAGTPRRGAATTTRTTTPTNPALPPQTTSDGNNRQQRWIEAWEKQFALLREYKSEFGDCNVPTSKKHPKIQNQYRPLAKWIAKQRTALNYYDKDPIQHPLRVMTMEQRQRLLDLGFCQNYKDVTNAISTNHQIAYQTRFNKTFDERLEELKAFKKQHGHVNVPNSHVRLYGWLRSIEHQYKLWHEEKHGDKTNDNTGRTNHDNGNENNDNDDKKKKKKKSNNSGFVSLQMDHLVALTNLGWSMRLPNRKSVQERVQEYVSFVQTHGRFPKLARNDAEERSLANHAGRWRKMRRQQQEQQQGDGESATTPMDEEKAQYNVLTDEAIAQLDSVRFAWQTQRPNNNSANNPSKKPREQRRRATHDPKMDLLSWQDKYELLKSYKAKHGHVEVPHKHRKLGRFVAQTREHYKKMKEGKKSSSLTLERYRLLSKLNFRFEMRPRTGSCPRLRGWGSDGYDTTSSEEEEEGEDDNDNKGKQQDTGKEADTKEVVETVDNDNVNEETENEIEDAQGESEDGS